jgi:hypothetical protein
VPFVAPCSGRPAGRCAGHGISGMIIAMAPPPLVDLIATASIARALLRP